MPGRITARNPDGSLSLEEALGADLPHYSGIISRAQAGDRRELASRPERSRVPQGTPVRRNPAAPAGASSCGELARSPQWSWDVCAYYLRLGVRWTATKSEIRRAYLAACQREGGQLQDEKLTYVTAMLLDPVIRRAYDLTGLGDTFLLDREIDGRIRRAASWEAGQRMARGEDVTADDVIEEMGFQQSPRAPQDEAEEPAAPPPSRWGSEWGYYVLAGPDGVPEPDPALLEEHQGLVAAALRERGITAGFAVAMGGEDSPLVLRKVNESCIFVVSSKGTSPQLARKAVGMGITLGIIVENQNKES